MSRLVPRRVFAQLSLLLGFPGALGCERSTAFEVRRPGAAPQVFDATDFLTNDLDLVVRLDLKQLRLALGPDALLKLHAQAENQGAKTGAFGQALEQAHSAWLALRPSVSAATTDSVLVLSGDFSTTDLHRQDPATWSPALALGGLLRVYERRGSAKRAEPARAYAHGDDTLVFVSVAEIDSVERVIAAGPDEKRLEPMASGLLSFQLRPRVLPVFLAARAPKLSGLLEQARKVSGLLESEGETLKVSVEMLFLTEQAAAEALSLIRQLLAVSKELYPKFGGALNALQTQAQGVSLLLSVRLSQSYFR